MNKNEEKLKIILIRTTKAPTKYVLNLQMSTQKKFDVNVGKGGENG